jgi:hypothetical protein
MMLTQIHAVLPLRRVHYIPFKGVATWDIRDVGPVQLSDSGNNDVGAVVPGTREDVPTALILPVSRFQHLGVEPNIVVNVFLRRDCL